MRRSQYRLKQYENAQKTNTIKVFLSYLHTLTPLPPSPHAPIKSRTHKTALLCDHAAMRYTLTHIWPHLWTQLNRHHNRFDAGPSHGVESTSAKVSTKKRFFPQSQIKTIILFIQLSRLTISSAFIYTSQPAFFPSNCSESSDSPNAASGDATSRVDG